MNLLCIEPRVPGKLGRIVEWLVRRRGCRATIAYHQVDADDFMPRAESLGIEFVRFDVGGVAREQSVAWWRGFERGLCYAYGAWEVIEARRPRPVDIILGRSGGLGSTLFLPSFAPRTPVVQHFDQFLHPRTNDLADEDAPHLPEEYVLWRRSANAMDLVDLENGVAPWTHTRWQRDLYPAEYREAIRVVDPAVDISRFARLAPAPLSFGGRAIPDDCKVVTFVASALDRLHGFDRFVALAQRLLAERADVICLAAGSPLTTTYLDVSYHGADFPAALLADHPLRAHERFWNLGRIAGNLIPGLLARSDLYVCPERPHPISTPIVEAMAAGCLILAADAPPVLEFLEDTRNSLVCGFDDLEHVFARAREALDDRAAFAPLARAAAETARARLDQDVVYSGFADWLATLVFG